VTRNETGAWGRDIVPILIPDVGHHMDLMFSNKLDTPGVIQARELERAYIAKWIDQHRARRRAAGKLCASDKDCLGSYCMDGAGKKPPYACHGAY
jgi:hypothetical protein